MEEFRIDSKGPKWPIMLLKKNTDYSSTINYRLHLLFHKLK